MKKLGIRILIVTVLVFLSLLNWYIPGIFSAVLLFFALFALFAKITFNIKQNEK